jgi:hypothetical protein
MHSASARHIIGCHSSPETRAGFKTRLMTWRAVFISPYRADAALYASDRELFATPAGSHTHPRFGSTWASFVGYVGCMMFPRSIRQGHTWRCDQNGLG